MDVLAQLMAGDPETWKAWLELLAPRLRLRVIEMIGDVDQVEVDEFTGLLLLTIVQTMHQVRDEKKTAA